MSFFLVYQLLGEKQHEKKKMNKKSQNRYIDLTSFQVLTSFWEPTPNP